MSRGSGRAGAGARILRNFGRLSAVKVASDLFTFAYFVVASRVFGQEGIGEYSFAMALTGFFALFGDFGLYNLTIKEASTRRDFAVEGFGPVLVLRIALSLASFAALLAVLPWIPLSGQGRAVVVLIGAYQLAYKLTYGFAALFVARERMGVLAALEFGLRFVTALAGSAIALAGGSLVASLAVLPAVALLEIAVAGALAVRHFGAPRLRGALAQLPVAFRQALPYGLSSVLFQLQSRVDVLFLGLLLGVAAAGVYNAAYRIVFLLSFLTYYAGVALFPAASRLYQEAPEQLRVLYRDALRILVLLGVPAASGIALVAPDLIGRLFGEEFAASAPVLRVLSCLLITTSLKNLLSFFLMACDGQALRVRSQWIAALLNVALTWGLIPLLGVMGAALAAVASEALLVGLLVFHLRPSLGWPPVGSRVAASALASAGFCAPFAWLAPLPLAVVVPASLLIYAAGLAAFPDLRRAELRAVLEGLRARGFARRRSAARA